MGAYGDLLVMIEQERRDEEEFAQRVTEEGELALLNALLAAAVAQTIVDMRSDDGNQPDNR